MREFYTFLLCLVTFNSFASIKEKEIENKIPGHKLQLKQETFLTDTNGIVNAAAIVNVSLGSLVKICRTDGFTYSGKITEIEESTEFYKIYGSVLNVEDTQFGFVIAKGGVFAGAVVEKKNKKTYVLELSIPHKGYILILSSKYDEKIS